jgi:quinol monooxygenase YgiN
MWQTKPMQSNETHWPVRSGLGRAFLAVAVITMMLFRVDPAQAQERTMMVRISEIQVHEAYLEQYKEILREEAEASVRLEPGVIAIFPMIQRERATEIRILEMYADREAYDSHLKTPHFLKYKSSTLPMVKSLRLVDMQAIDPATMARMFKKLDGR